MLEQGLHYVIAYNTDYSHHESQIAVSILCRLICSHETWANSQSTQYSQLLSKRTMVATSKLRPKFQGGKMKLRTAYKERFRSLSDGTIKIFPAGFRHRRFRKGKAQKQRLKSPHAMHHTYANTLKRLGFKWVWHFHGWLQNVLAVESKLDVCLTYARHYHYRVDEHLPVHILIEKSGFLSIKW